MHKYIKSLALFVGFAATIATAVAQVGIARTNYISNLAPEEAPALNMILGCVPATTTTFNMLGSFSWSTEANGATVPAGDNITAGVADVSSASGDATFYPSAAPGGQNNYALLNGGLRGTIVGYAFSADAATNRVLKAHFHSMGGLSFSILGPTLDQYGVRGAVNFSWTVHDTRDGRTWSGYGETSFYIAAASDGYNSIDVEVVPTYAFENGDVLAQVTAQ